MGLPPGAIINVFATEPLNGGAKQTLQGSPQTPTQVVRTVPGPAENFTKALSQPSARIRAETRPRCSTFH